MSYIHHIFDFIIFPFYAQYYQRFIYIFSKIYDSAPSPSPDTASALAFPVSLQPHSGVYTNAKGQISSSLVLLDSPFSVADC